MNANRKTARIVGALFLTVNVAFILGTGFLVEPILSGPDYLTLASTSQAQVSLGVILDLINDVALLGIAVLMFPLLKQRFESLALGYLSIRVVEFVMIIAADLSALSLLALKVEPGTAESFQSVGTLLLAQRQSAFLMVTCTFALGALVFYAMLHRVEFVPRFISLWGMIAAILVLVTFVVDLFGISLNEDIESILSLPMLLNEMFLGLWLIFKGFNSQATGFEVA